MQFTCKRCGTKKEIRVFSKNIFRCFCDKCGSTIPNGKVYGLILITMHSIMMIRMIYRIQSEADVSYIGLFFGYALFSILVWIVASFIGGRGNWYGDDADYLKERDPKHPAYCQECGRIVDISLVQEVRCPQCHKKFSFRAFKEMGDLPISLNIVAIIIVMIVGEWGKAIEDGLTPLFVENHKWVPISFHLVMVSLLAFVANLIVKMILIFVYQKRVMEKK